MLKITVTLCFAITVSACTKDPASEMGKAFAGGGTPSIADQFSGLGGQAVDYAKSSADGLYEATNQIGKNWGKAVRPVTAISAPVEVREKIISCSGHPISETRIITSSGIKHFTADTGVECLP